MTRTHMPRHLGPGGGTQLPRHICEHLTVIRLYKNGVGFVPDLPLVY